MVAGPGFEPGMLRAYETGVVAALPAILFIKNLYIKFLNYIPYRNTLRILY